ncbi:DUF6973 domain-containing protein [Paenibacillus sp. 481]|uniref:DUF6973 domain-containing protein n=1 Tax=Paenibacillus sp. 481 TaxID=2835869 RepID=UPI001E29E8CD|nr:hypothetical protein [Paenibacillus sp. 481]UHA74960.1 hypothetical protein KIK04_07985 [Paenibacillus sp. 481]
MILKKSIIAISVLSTAVLTPLSASAQADPTVQSISQNMEQQGMKEITFETFFNSDFYKDLPKDDPAIAFYQQIDHFKKQHPNLSPAEIVRHFDEEAIQENISYDQWSRLTLAEKALVASHPVNAAITVSTSKKAFQFTQAKYGRNGLGDVSDAYRHAIWNALMCKYVSKNWASLYGTAHETKPASELVGNEADGYSKIAHRDMDLYNNQKGRDCWNVLTDSIAWVSDTDLQNRVSAKLNAGELRWLH